MHPVPALRRTVAQVTSRAFVGLPLCMNIYMFIIAWVNIELY